MTPRWRCRRELARGCFLSGSAAATSVALWRACRPVKFITVMHAAAVRGDGNANVMSAKSWLAMRRTFRKFDRTRLGACDRVQPASARLSCESRSRRYTDAHLNRRMPSARGQPASRLRGLGFHVSSEQCIFVSSPTVIYVSLYFLYTCVVLCAVP